MEILETHIDADDPILSIKIDLLKILFTNQQYHLTEEDEALPLQLLHKEDLTAQACAVKTWHRTLHKDLDANTGADILFQLKRELLFQSRGELVYQPKGEPLFQPKGELVI